MYQFIKTNVPDFITVQAFISVLHANHSGDSPNEGGESHAACSISIPSLHKLCRSQCGCGPITYFISLKLGAAKRLMQESSLNFSQIAAQLGFSSVHYFSRLFKAKTGMSPSQYARSINRR